MSINHSIKAICKSLENELIRQPQKPPVKIDTLADTINTLVEADKRAQCSQVAEEGNTTHTLLFLVCSVFLSVLIQTGRTQYAYALTTF